MSLHPHGPFDGPRRIPVHSMKQQKYRCNSRHGALSRFVHDQPTFRSGESVADPRRHTAGDSAGICGRSCFSMAILSCTPARVCGPLTRIIRRWNRILAASPNAAHYALAVLLTLLSIRRRPARTLHPHYRERRWPQHIRAPGRRASPLWPCPFEAEDQSPTLPEMHGRLLDTLYTGCDHREHITADPFCPALDEDSGSVPISVEQLPHCHVCGSLLRPGVAWFDEIPHHLRAINVFVEKADLCLVVGTSSTATRTNRTVAVFNSEPAEDDDFAQFFFLGPCAETLPRILLNVQALPLEQ
ncbi:DHS-like NAD/FAD-binding domain-containing protein [Mycena latifolia]|nr:DHS-like NAD/FAD-binding domain-containing protein [Mycena latifolia]